MSDPTAAMPTPRPPDCNAALVLADGRVFWGRGLGEPGQAVGEVCFNTAITGYQEILTDPSYAGQIITFTFPHIGNVGANHEDIETTTPVARGLVIRTAITEPSNYRAAQSLDQWLRSHGIVGLSGVEPRFHVVAVDYGMKRNILRMLAERGCRVTVVPATASTEDILRHQPDGIFLSNGPGDPAATGEYAVPVLRELINTGKPIFGICLGHQMLALALGGRTSKMARGHRGANHPVQDLATGKVEITSQNHGFVVDPDSLPAGIEPTHLSLFDRSNEGLQLRDLPVFSVQHHPEASPGPQDSHYLFQRFIEMMAANGGGTSRK